VWVLRPQADGEVLEGVEGGERGDGNDGGATLAELLQKVEDERLRFRSALFRVGGHVAVLEVDLVMVGGLICLLDVFCYIHLLSDLLVDLIWVFHLIIIVLFREVLGMIGGWYQGLVDLG
jgi:hypothetical protein